ncbi:MAG: tubulin/FtsZ family protein [Chloroflexota bacterium]
MRLLVIGCGQCGGRIADEFARAGAVARSKRGIEIVCGAFAVNTDMADLSGLLNIKSDYQHRLLIGSQKTGGHGVGKMNALGAEIARDDADKVVDVVRTMGNFPETDAVMLCASAAGGTGSGSIAVLTQELKHRYPDKLIYNLIVLPFSHEEMTERRTIYNTATCLKSSYLVADAVFLVDNQRFVMKGRSMRDNLTRINYSIVRPFYNLLCAGEEKRPEFIGARTLDAGDIMESLAGWTVIGYGRSRMPRVRFSLGGSKHDFRHKASQTHKGLDAMQEALGGLSLKVSPTDAKRALYLLSGPTSQMSLELIKGLGDCLKGMAADAIIRSGDYPRGDNALDVTVILSELTTVAKVIGYFNRAVEYINAERRQRQGVAYAQKSIEDVFKDIPSLL